MFQWLWDIINEMRDRWNHNPYFDEARERMKNLKEKRAHSSLATVLEIIAVIICVTVGFGYIAAPVFFQTNTTDAAGWDAPSRTIWSVLFIFTISMIVIGLIALAVKHNK